MTCERISGYFRLVSGLAEILIPEKTCYSYDRNQPIPDML